MAKKSDGTFLRQVASSAGHMAGFVEGAIESVVHAGHQIGSPETEPVHEHVRFEKSDFASRGVLIGGACFLGAMWLTIGLLYFYFTYLKNYRAEVSPPALPISRSGAALPPRPRLQASPEQDLKTFRASEDWELTHYYWLDKSKGQVAIPIEQAVQTLAQRGIAPQNTAPNPTLTPPQEGTRSTGFEGKVNPEPR
jgi:hypothetical protein